VPTITPAPGWMHPAKIPSKSRTSPVRGIHMWSKLAGMVLVGDTNMAPSLGPPFHVSAMPTVNAPSGYWGEEVIWDSKANNHNSMFDKEGRLWLAANVRGPDNHDFCKKGSDHPSAKVSF
jgi:hypothetical protein